MRNFSNKKNLITNYLVLYINITRTLFVQQSNDMRMPLSGCPMNRTVTVRIC